MAILFYLTTFFFSFGQLARISFYNQQVNFYLYEIVLLFSLAWLILKYGFKPIEELWKSQKTFFLFPSILLLSLINGFGGYSLFQNTVGLLYLLRLIMYGTYWIYMTYELKKNKKTRQIMQHGLLIFVFATIITTLVQYFLYPDLRNLIYQGWDPHLYRTFGVFFDTGVAGAIYGLIFLFSNNIYIKTAFLIFLVLSFSRSSYLSLAIVFIYLFVNKRSFNSLFIGLFILLFLIFIVPKPAGEGVNLKRTFSVVSRIEDYRQGFGLFLEKPVLGFGYNRLRYVREVIDDSHSGASFSSSYITILVTAGLMGLMSLIGLMWKIWKKKEKFRPLLLFLAAISFGDNVIFHPFILFLGGVLFILSDRQQ